MKHVGILAHSFEGAGLALSRGLFGRHSATGPSHASRNHAHRRRAAARNGGMGDGSDLATLRTMFENDARKLAAAGADFFILPDNTAHIALESAARSSPPPRPAHR